MNKRLFFILASAVVLIGLIVGIYFLFFAGKGATLDVGNPFGDIGSGTIAPGGDLPTTDDTIPNAGTTIGPRFVKITDGPVARGSVAFDIELPDPDATVATTGSSTVTKATIPDVEVHFIDRASGNVYAYIAHARTLTRISNKTLPGVQYASWVPDGTHAFAQFVATSDGSEQVNTYSLDSHGAGGYLLESNLDQAMVVGSSTLFSMLSGSNGSVGTLSRVDGSNARTLFTSVLSSLIVHPTTGNYFATNKASARLDGFAFQINSATGVFTRILGPFRGLAILPSSTGTALMYSYTSGGAYQLRLMDVASRTSTALPLATLAEKCVWAANGLSAYCAVPTNLSGNLPDNWYQGATVFTDRIWKIDLGQRVASLVVDPSETAKENIDAVNLTLDPDEDMLIFTDKHSGALYAYDL